MRFAGPHQRPRQWNGGGAAGQRGLFDSRPTGKAQSEQFCCFVEGFARRIVNRRCQPTILPDPFHGKQLAVPPRHEQQQIRKVEIGIEQARRQSVPFKVIDGNQWFARSVGERLARNKTNHHPADQSRASGSCNGVDIAKSNTGINKRCLDQGHDRFDMRTRGNFRNDAAIGRMFTLLPSEPMGKDPAVAGDQRCCGFITTGFNTKDQRGVARHETVASTVFNMTASPPHIRLGTRGSPLALTQARMTRDALIAAHGWGEDAVEIVTITTDGDRIQDRPLAEIGGKALWTKTLDRALMEGRTDASVHSMKDVETMRPDGIALVAMLERADVRDRLIGATGIDSLPQGAVIGTASPRRAAQLLRLRPDLKIVSFRGNVATRIARVENGEADATMLAAAGLDRLGHPEIGVAIDPDTMLPAVAQGAVGIECRSNDAATAALLVAINHHPTHVCVAAERALLAALGGGCHSPVGVLAELDNGMIYLRAEILTENGDAHRTGEARFAPDDVDAPARLARALMDGAPPSIAALFSCAS